MTELLAPAGDWDCLRAAVANGADAVYFGLSGFNARHRAANFTLEELPATMAWLHDRNVKGYVAFNTLIFSDELDEAARCVAGIAEAGADAVIVQDVGLIRLIRRMAPDLPIHASTQTTLCEPRGIDFARGLGVERVILARELSLAEIGQVASQTEVPLEVFVHGALCVAYSGQCLTSEALGGRSANRGQCAQACRMPYELVVDGQVRDLGDKAYLLSPQDLAAYDLVDRLVQLGVSCLKIEGRLKTPAYVAQTTRTYRAALDHALRGLPFTLDHPALRDLNQVYSRGFSHGFLDGVNHQVLVHARFPKSRGVLVGTVAGRTRRGVLVEPAQPADPDYLRPGDGVVFDLGRPEEDEPGGRLYEVHPRGEGRLELVLGHDAKGLDAIPHGCRVWKTDDPALKRQLEHSFAVDRPYRRVPVHAVVAGNVGGPLTLDVEDAAGRRSTAVWAGPLEWARVHPLTVESATEQLGRLGETPFELAGLTIDCSEPVMVPKSVLNQLRREAVDKLQALGRSASVRQVVEPDALTSLRTQAARREARSPREPTLHVLVRTQAQLEALLAWRPAEPGVLPGAAYCDFEDVRRYVGAVEQCRGAGWVAGVATLRVIKPGEEGWLAQIAKSRPDVVLARNLAAVRYFREHHPHVVQVGDFSLNAANELAADLILAQGLERLVPSYDLNWEQFSALMRRSRPDRFEAVIHQHMPMFHMEHCVFAHLLSNGKDFRDCGRPCDRHRIELTDRVGASFPVLADAGCRNTVFNSVAQSGAEYTGRMLSLGVSHFRVELVREAAEEVHPLLNAYSRVLAGIDDGKQTWRGLQVLNQLGVTRGTLALT
jgi:putative protease